MIKSAAHSIHHIRKECDSLRLKASLENQLSQFAAQAAAFRSLVKPFEPERTDRPGMLQGVALAHKDVFDLPHHCPGVGRPPREAVDHRPMSSPLTKLTKAGALNMGSLTLSELCCGATGESRYFGQPVNPLNSEVVVGGSSSGSAVAVAGGLCVASLGTDTAGSVRIPAATCGVIGLAPTRGRVGSQGVFRLSPSLDTVGLLARSASDAAHVWTVIAAPTSDIPQADESPLIEANLISERAWKLGFSADCATAQEEVACALGQARREFAERWCVTDRKFEHRIRLNAWAQTVLHAEAAALHIDVIREERGEKLPPSVRSILLPGLAIPSLWYARALESRAAAYEAFLRGPMLGLDMLLTPAIGMPLPKWKLVVPGSPEYDRKHLLAMHEHFPWVNYLGLPSIVFPIGYDRSGLPISIQAIGRAGSELTLLAFAHQAMQLMGTSVAEHQP